MSNERSPRPLCSTTIGTSAMLCPLPSLNPEHLVNVSAGRGGGTPRRKFGAHPCHATMATVLGERPRYDTR